MSRRKHFETRGIYDLLPLLQKDYFDLIVGGARLLPTPNREQYEWRKFFSSPEAVFIPLGHPLFDQNLTSFAECREYPFIILNPGDYPQQYALLTELGKKHGFTPRIAMSCINTESAYCNPRFFYNAPS